MNHKQIQVVLSLCVLTAVAAAILLILYESNNTSVSQPRPHVVQDMQILSDNKQVLSVPPSESPVLDPMSNEEHEIELSNTDETDETVSVVMTQLEAMLDGAISGLDSAWAIYVEDLETGDRAVGEHNISCDSEMISASIIKMFIMAAIFDSIEKGELDEESLYEDIYQMITISDNGAANRLVRQLGSGDEDLGMARVNEYAASIGCEHTKMNRLMLVENGLQNYVSAIDCATLLRMLYEGNCVTQSRSEEMLSIMKDQYWNEYIPTGLPEGTVIAHKSGDLIGLCQGDVGIIYDETGPYILCIICNHPQSFNACEQKIVDFARLIHDYMALRSSDSGID